MNQLPHYSGPTPSLSETVRSTERLADAVGSLSPRRDSRFKSIYDCDVGIFDVPMNSLADLISCDYSQEQVEAKCRHCSTVVKCARIVSPFVACDPCIKRIKEQQEMERTREYWYRVCPEQFRTTDINHPKFHKGAYARVKAVDPGKSLFLHGPSGAGKTRIGMLRLKSAVLRGMSVKVVWPEQLESFKGYNAEAKLENLATFDMVLMDDPLLTACREPKLADTLKHLIDILMRHQKPFIVTSQIGEDDFLSGNTYGDLKASDRERGFAIMRRLKENCEVISFRAE